MSEVSYSNVPPMMAAIKSGDIEAIRSLLHAGHSPNEPQCYQVMIGDWPRDDEAFPLELAVLENRMDMVQLLIECGADLTHNPEELLCGSLRSQDLTLFSFLVDVGVRIPATQRDIFASYYYGEADSPYFPGDIDNYALEYFGSEQYYSDKFQDEAYLFIPFDENYYQAMAKVMEKRFVNWQGQSFDEATLESSEVAQAIMEYLDCECTYFPSMTDDDPIMSAYNYAKRESVKEGFVPVLIKADDEILWECLIMNSDPDSDGEDDFAFDPDKVAEYRKKMLSAPVENSKAVLEEMIGQRKEEAEDDDMDWDEEILGEMEGGYDNRRFSSYWNSDNDMTYPLILAKIPVKNPWELFAWLPFGNWNECPDTPELMAVAKYWFEQHGAVPAAMSHDELEFLLPAPVSQEKAMEVAAEQYGFCPDIVDQEQDDPTVGNLADVLRQSTVWYFWWD